MTIHVPATEVPRLRAELEDTRDRSPLPETAAPARRLLARPLTT